MHDERRNLPDRRINSFRSILHGAFGGRRVAVRRSDTTHAYVDHYHPSLVYVSFGIVLLCCADAYFTLMLLQRGATEMNPVMDALIRRNVQIFLNVKIVWTCVAVVFLLLHKNFVLFNLLSTARVIYALFAAYAVLIVYEIALLILF
ncbi:MAG: DUF5658 family protein [Burkholderiales bacterium]